MNPKFVVTQGSAKYGQAWFRECEVVEDRKRRALRSVESDVQFYQLRVYEKPQIFESILFRPGETPKVWKEWESRTIKGEQGVDFGRDAGREKIRY